MKRVGKGLLMLAIACILMMQHGLEAKADLTWRQETLEGIDVSKAVKLTSGEKYKTNTKNIQSAFLVTSESSDGYNYEEVSKEKVTGTLYSIKLKEMKKVDVLFVSDGSEVVNINRGISDYSPQILGKNLLKDTFSITNSNFGKTDTVYFWVSGDTGSLTIKPKITSLKADAYEGEIAKSGDQIYVYSWNDEMGRRLEYFYEKYPQYKDKVVYYNFACSGVDLAYCKSLEKYAWDSNNNTSIVVMDGTVKDYMFKRNEFVTLDKLGIADDYANAYDYTKQEGTYNGKLYFATPEAAVGNFVYDAKIAKKVLGTSDPAKVQAMIKSPSKFLQVAKKMKEAGYYMTTGINALYDDYFEDSSFDNINVEKAKALTVALQKKGYDTGSLSWSNDWMADMCSGKVFGVFGCTWFDMWSLNETKLLADGKICPGPLTYSWGGSYIGVTNQGKNEDLAALVLQTICCDTGVMKNMANNGECYIVNNRLVNKKFAADDNRASNYFGGQNLYNVWHQVGVSIGKNDSISLKNPPKTIKKNDVVKVGKASYKVTSVEKKTVAFKKTTSTEKLIVVPSTVKIEGKTYKVTQISAYAFKNNKTMTKVAIGKNVKIIGKAAFKNCTKLKTAVINSKVLKSIGVSAFEGDKKLTKMTLKTTKLNKASVGKNALKGTNSKLVINVPDNKVKVYKVYFSKKGNTKVKVK